MEEYEAELDKLDTSNETLRSGKERSRFGVSCFRMFIDRCYPYCIFSFKRCDATSKYKTGLSPCVITFNGCDIHFYHNPKINSDKFHDSDEYPDYDYVYIIHR